MCCAGVCWDPSFRVVRAGLCSPVGAGPWGGSSGWSGGGFGFGPRPQLPREGLGVGQGDRADRVQPVADDVGVERADAVQHRRAVPAGESPGDQQVPEEGGGRCRGAGRAGRCCSRRPGCSPPLPAPPCRAGRPGHRCRRRRPQRPPATPAARRDRPEQGGADHRPSPRAEPTSRAFSSTNRSSGCRLRRRTQALGAERPTWWAGVLRPGPPQPPATRRAPPALR